MNCQFVRRDGDLPIQRRDVRLTIVSSRRKFMRMLTMMAEDWDDCVSSDAGMRETTCKARLSSRITNAMFTLHMLTIVAYSAGILLADVDFADQRAELPLLLKVNLPVDISTKRTYRLLLSAQFVHLIMSGCGTGLLNSLLLALVSLARTERARAVNSTSF